VSQGNVGWAQAVQGDSAGGRGLPNRAPACRRLVPAGAPAHAPREDFGAKFVCCGVSVAEVGVGGGRRGILTYACTEYVGASPLSTCALHSTVRTALRATGIPKSNGVRGRVHLFHSQDSFCALSEREIPFTPFLPVLFCGGPLHFARLAWSDHN